MRESTTDQITKLVKRVGIQEILSPENGARYRDHFSFALIRANSAMWNACGIHKKADSALIINGE